VLRGVGYPVDSSGHPIPALAASLLRDDKLSKLRKQYAEMGRVRDNTRFGWMRTRG